MKLIENEFDKVYNDLNTYYLSEDNKEEYLIPSIFKLTSYSKQNCTNYKAKSGLYLIIGPRIIDNKLIAPPNELSFDDIKNNWPHYVGQAVDIAERLIDHLLQGFIGEASKSEPNSKLHKYMKNTCRLADTNRESFYINIANNFKFYAFELKDAEKAIGTITIPNYSNYIQTNLANIINDGIIDDNFISELKDARMEYFNKASKNPILNSAEAFWTSNNNFSYSNDQEDLIHLNSVLGGKHVHGVLSLLKSEDVKKIVQTIILLNYTFYSTKLITSITGIKYDTISDINKLITNSFFTKALLGNVSTIRDYKLDQNDESKVLDITVYEGRNILYNKISMPTYNAVKVFCGYIFKEFSIDGVTAKPDFTDVSGRISNITITDTDQLYKISFHISPVNKINAYNNFKNFLLNDKSDYVNNFSYSSDDTIAIIDSELNNKITVFKNAYDKTEKISATTHTIWDKVRLELLKKAYIDNKYNDGYIASHPELLDLPADYEISREGIKSARQKYNIVRVANFNNMKDVIKDAVEKLNIKNPYSVDSATKLQVKQFIIDNLDKYSYNDVIDNLQTFDSNFSKRWSELYGKRKIAQ